MTDGERQLIADKLLASLARREYGYHELLGKFGNQFDRVMLGEVLDDFVGKGWQSDSRYAQSYTQSAVNRGKGELFIRQHLRQQHITEALIDSALAEHDFYALAADIYQKKYHGSAAADRKELAKRQRFLAGRGFSFEQIHEVLNHHDD